MNAQDSAIELLVIDPSLNAGEQQVSTLRNAGIAIHPTLARGLDDLAEPLQQPQLDLILCSADGDPDVFTEISGYCLRNRPEVPLVIVYLDQDPDVLLQALRNGARDVVSKEDAEHLLIVVQREFQDLSNRRALQAAQERLRETEARCTTLMDHSRDAIAYIHEGMHVRANPVYLELFGFLDMEEIEGLPILDMIAADDLPKFKKFLRSAASTQGELEIRCRNSKDQVFDAVIEFSPASIDGESCTQIIIRDRSGTRQLEERLEQVSSLDPRTGLLNRDHFMIRLQSILSRAREQAEPLHLLYLSIDDFQEIRTRIGLAAIDTLLKDFSLVLRQPVAEGDTLARFGDHAFTIATAGTLPQAMQLARQILEAIASHPFRIGDQTVKPRCSIGIAGLTEGIANAHEFINSAYQACISAHDENDTGIACYSDGEMAPSYGDGTIDAHINDLIGEALTGDGFKLVYQPVVSLQGESREFYAVLTRLVDHDQEEILPEDFIHAAEQGNQMADIDRWVIRHAIVELVRQRQQGRKVSFFVTLSEASLKDDQLLIWVCDQLRELQARGAWLIFQISEPLLRIHLQQAKTLLEGLKKIKCQIAVDQFGGADNSESLLKQLPVDYVRFDPSLAERLTEQQDKQDRLTELNKSIQSQGVKTIVMGVEDANSLAVLWTVGVNYIQGYFLQEPSEQISYEFGSD